jgi:hypothetical protein
VREDGRIVGGEGWQENVYDMEEWKKLLKMARNRHILHMPMKWNRINSLYFWKIVHLIPVYVSKICCIIRGL